jgi:cell division protein FtsB
MSHLDPAHDLDQSRDDAVVAWRKLAELRERENATLRARVVKLEEEVAYLRQNNETRNR